MRLDDLPTFVDKISNKIMKLKQDHHKYAIVSSGTAYQINKCILSKAKMEIRQDMQRSLLYEWSELRQTLCGLTGVIRDNMLWYKFGTSDEIKKWMMLDANYLTRLLIVNDLNYNDIFEYCSHKIRIAKFSECLFID